MWRFMLMALIVFSFSTSMVEAKEQLDKKKIEKYDRDGDGKLSDEELEEASKEIKDQLEGRKKSLRQK